MLNRNPSPANTNGRVPLDLSSILLVEQDAELRASRRTLLGCLKHPVLAVGAYPEVCRLPRGDDYCLVAVDLSPNEQEARRVAAHARLTWPGAKILLLGQPSMDFDDPLYDDSVSPACNPSGVVETAKRLLTMDHPRCEGERPPRVDWGKLRHPATRPTIPGTSESEIASADGLSTHGD